MTPYETLVTAAIHAPSGDNTQPWRFLVDCASQRIEVWVDENRDQSPMNAGQRMARIAVGAAVENMLRTATYNGWDAQATFPDNVREATIVRVDGLGNDAGEIDDAVKDRVTNRQVYRKVSLPSDVLCQLKNAVPSCGGVHAQWGVQRAEVTQLAPLIARADAVLFANSSMRRAFLANVRFDAASNVQVEYGLSLGSLELTAADRFGMRLLTLLPDRVLGFARAERAFASKSRALVDSASGICIIVAPDDTPKSDYLVGQVMQRAWLAMTEQGLAVQPLMSLAVLENAAQQGMNAGRFEELISELRDVVAGTENGRLGFIMRFGYSAPVASRTGRRPLSSVMSLATVPPISTDS